MTGAPISIEVLYIDDCPNTDAALANVSAALGQLEAGLAARVVVSTRRIATPAEAAAVRFGGSPTVLLNGIGLDPAAERTQQLACRIYLTPAGPAGAPAIAQIRGAIERAVLVGD